MTDRFKFRVWDSEFKKYRTGLAINNGLVCTYDDRVCILEQCTGLKDKNGKLIYENDLITKDNTIYRVDWCQDKLGFVLRNESNPDDTLESLDITINKWEVIGNIHENADLLGEDK